MRTWTRTAASPAPKGLHTDARCGTPWPEGVEGRDQDCGILFEDGLGGTVSHFDSSCAMAPPGSLTPLSDSDCGKPSSPFSVHQDEDCALLASDQDCGGPFALNSVMSDDDCGIALQGGGVSSDSDCGKASWAGGRYSDSDCELPKPGGGTHSDEWGS